MKPNFILNLVGNNIGKVYSYSLNKQLLLVISIVTIFMPFVFMLFVWRELDTDQRLTFINSVFMYYGSITGILVGAYSYNKVRQNGHDDEE